MFKYIFILIILLVPSNLFSQSNYGPRQPVVLKYADSLVGSTIENAPKRELIGRVHLTQANVDTHCDRAIQYFGENKFELIGNVVITQEELTIRAPKIIYYGDKYLAESIGEIALDNKGTYLKANAGTYSTFKHIADFYGDVSIENDSILIKADTIQYNKENENSFAHGGAVLRNKYKSSIALGDSVWHFKNKDYSILIGDAFIIKLDTIDKFKNIFAKDSSDIVVLDTTLISAKYLESIGYEQYFFAKDSVQISGKGYFAKGDTAVLYESQKLARLIGKPELKSDSSQLYSDTIDIIKTDAKSYELIASNKAIFASRQDTQLLDRIDQISGTKITCYYINDTLRSIFSDGDAKSLYFQKKDTLPDGLNRASCDQIEILFENKAIYEINCIGKAYEDYNPESIVSGIIKSFYLPTFRWKDNWGKPRSIPKKYYKNLKK